MNSDAELSASRAALAVTAVGAAGLTLTETLAITINRVVPSDSVRLLALKMTSWPLFLVGCVIGYLSRTAGNRSWLLVATAIALVFTLAKRFRGNWIWAGTFRDYQDSPWPWILVLAAGCVVGLLPWTSRKAGSFNSTAWVIVAGFAAVISWIVGLVWPLNSEFAQTRPIALGALTMVLGALAWRIEG